MSSPENKLSKKAFVQIYAQGLLWEIYGVIVMKNQSFLLSNVT